MPKVHLDTDLGGDIDDLCALALLLRWPGVELTGITTNSENAGKRAGAVRYVLDMEGQTSVPVAAGADASDGYYRVYPGLPPEERYWPQPIVPIQNSLQAALQLLQRSVEQEAVIIAIGAYTNLSLLEQRHPGILEQANLFLMGGYLYPTRTGYPAWGNEMDWNIQVDVKSAQHVLEHSHPTLIPLTVTVETALRRAYLDDLRQAGALGRLLARQAEAFAEDEQNESRIGAHCPALPSDIINFQHDPLACAIALGWRESVEIAEVPVLLEIQDGWLVERIHPSGKPLRVVTQVDGMRFSQFWLDRVRAGL
jgi:inosine-uridine nucleoside N-ribohydrolase